MDLREPLIEATKKLTALRAEIDQLRARSTEPIAIVGVDCRLPGGVETPADYWRLLAEGRDAIGPFPADRWDASALFHPDPDASGKTYSTSGGFLGAIDRFDAAFFGIAPREAAAMDPAQRIALECAWTAVEHAGIRPSDLRSSPTGIYFGAVGSDYEPWGGRRGVHGMDGYAFTGRDTSVLSGRIAYTLGSHGPAITINTACSSSLVALHLACRALRTGECDLAICGGVQVMTTPAGFVEFSRLRGVAPDGRCKSFADAADGTGWSEGCGVLVLERLSDALRNGGRRIVALVRGTAVNQDGRSQGLTAPSGPAQERVIRRALEECGLTDADIDAVEGHGTGTSLGDPIEIGALAAVFAKGRERPLYLGSSKSNIGHTQAAAGVAGVIKMALALGREKLPRSLHAEVPTHHARWEESGLALLADAKPWPRGSRVRRAGVSSFGVCGTNAHVILEEAPLPSEPESAGPQLASSVPLVVSGTDEAALEAQVIRLAEHLEGRPEGTTLDVAYSLATSRTHHPARLALTVASDLRPGEVAARLRAAHEQRVQAEVREQVLARPRRGKLMMLFSGQGTQRPGMGKELHRRFPEFRRAFDAICAELDSKLPRPLREVIFAEPESDAAALLDQTQYTQPALFALSVALYRQWEAWGLIPDLVAGHSIGELAAAHVAGVLTLADAATLVAARGRAMQKAPAGGAMFVISAGPGEVADHLAGLEDRLSIAAVNAPEQTVISGDRVAAEAVASRLEARGRRVHRLRVSHAFHSPHMSGVLDELRAVAETIRPYRPRVPLLSNLTGKPFSTDEPCAADYWVRQLRGAVRFRDAIAFADEAGADCFIECGPGGALAGMVAATAKNAVAIPSLRGDGGEPDALIDALGLASVAGRSIDWPAVFAGRGAVRVEVPAYAFQRQRYWIDGAGLADDEAEGVGLARVEHPFLGAETALPDGGHLFTGRLRATSADWLAEHRVFGEVVLPGAAILELLGAAGARLGIPRVESLDLEAPIVVPPPAAGLQLLVGVAAPESDGRRAVRIHTRPTDSDASWRVHASGVLAPDADASVSASPWPPPDATAIDLADFYATLRARGIDYGPVFRCLREMYRRGPEVFARVALPASARTDGFAVHPALLDAGWHSLLASELDDGAGIPVPWNMHDAWIARSPTAVRELHVRLVPRGWRNGAHAAAVTFHDPAGALVCSVRTIRFGNLPGPRGSASATEARPHDPPPVHDDAAALYQVAWRRCPLRGKRRTGVFAILGDGDRARGLVAMLADAGVDARHCRTLEAIRDFDDRSALDTVVRVLEPAADASSLATAAIEATAVALEEQRTWESERDWAGARFALVTVDAIAAQPHDSATNLAHAALWGALRSVRRENPRRRYLLVDTDRTESSRSSLAAVLLAKDEMEVALRDGQRLVPAIERAQRVAPTSPLRADRTVLITGGTSGLGALVAEHLVARHGVRHLVLSSRRGMDAEGAPELANRLAALGCSVTIAACDVADRDALDKMLARIPEAHPLGSVFHCAAVLDDGLVASMGRAKLARIFAPKVEGLLHLHEATRTRDLDAFVVFSSIAGTLGSEGQSGYAAANAFVDALGAVRKATGLPALSLAWGPWAGTGMVGRLAPAHVERLRRAGFGLLDPTVALDLLDASLGRDEPILVPAILDADLWRRETMATIVPEPAPPSSNVVPVQPAAADPATFRQRLDAASPNERAELLLALVRTEVATVLKLPAPSDLHPAKTLPELGMDSLMAVDIRRRLEHRLSMQLPPTLVFDEPSCMLLADYLSNSWSSVERT